MDDVEEAVEVEPGPEQEVQPAGSPPCPVVAIGASAGGLEAFQELFRHMPADTGFAFVLIQHLSPRHQTLIASLLAPLTAMPVREVVADETVIEPNHVYVKPSSGTLTIDDCVLYVSKAPRLRGRRSPIDQFFRSLAEDQEDEAVGIVLTGTGTDGALGLKTIKEHGGLTLVQDPGTALYDSMPRGAILTGAVDHVLPVDQMPARLVEHLARLRDGQGSNPERVREEISGHLGKVCAVLRRETGHDFRHYKQTTLVRRVRRRMNEVRVDSVYAYMDHLNHDANEVEQLFRDLLISVTHFFRDPEAFELLAAKVVPQLFEGKDADSSVRVWIPGCATGEEAYSIAMLLREHLDGLEAPPQVLVFATDIDTQALEVARQALYPETVAAQISPERLERFFVKHGNMYQVSREVREVCLFSLHNLIADPPFSRLDLVSCRNLLIYLEPELQKKVAALFHYALRPGGFLFLGPSEMVAGQPELFRTLDKKHRVFQSRDTVARPPFSFPLGERSRLGLRPPEETLRRSQPRQHEVARTFEAVLIENYAPACVVVNESGDAVYFSPRTGRYLEPPAGTPSLNVVDMARKGLRLDVRTALHKAVNSRVQVVHENVAFEPDGQTGRVNVIVRPMPELGEDPGLFMVVFQEIVTAGEADGEAESGVVVADEPFVRRLEAELRATKDHLQATMEELESSNEELVSSNEELLSMNEELQSANEELQTSKEELQSVNEELETVNSELKKKLDELGRANSDLQNLFQSTRLATVFVDRELRIKKFTPAALEVFRLIDSDAGRPLADIVPRFAGVDLVGDVREVLRTLAARERQVRIEEGPDWYLLRILPYRTLDDVIDGVVLTFLDISELKRAQSHATQLARIVESSQDGIIGKSLEGVITSWNAGAERTYGYSAQEAIGRTMDLIVPPDRRSELPAAVEKLKQGLQVETFETVRMRKDGRPLNISLTLSPILDASGRLIGISGIDRDISDRKAAEAALVEAARRKDEFLALLGHELRNPLSPIRNCLHVLKTPDLGDVERQKALATAERQVVHLTRLVDDLLDVARISRGRIHLREERLDLAASVRTTVEDQRSAIAAAGLELDLELPAAPLWITGDATRLAQMVGNLLHNALKFTPRGGRISVVLREEEGTARLTVSDTGIGMETELLSRLFEPFSQSRSNPVHDRGGLGLGLALVKALIELHGGTVEASSPGKGRGTRIDLRLPRRSAAAEAAMTEPSRNDGASTPRRCLVIEDHADAAESMAVLLRLSGHEVEVAFDAAAGLELARSLAPEVVLCDIGLPGAMDGYGVARALREAPETRSAFLIALTGYGQEEDRRLALEAGFDAHLTKPADLEALYRLLASAGPR
jgi:two-component system, chemotaxis family, CheB/CheR fusion protein